MILLTNSLGFWDTNRSPNHWPDIELINKKKGNLLFSGFCHSGGPQSENEKKQKHKQMLRSC